MWLRETHESFDQVVDTAFRNAMMQIDAMGTDADSTHRHEQATATESLVLGGRLVHREACRCGAGEFEVFHDERLDGYELESTCERCRDSYFIMPTKEGWRIEEI